MSAPQDFRFDFAISYASEEEGLAGELADLLRESGAKVFFATHEKVYLLGKRLEPELRSAFGVQTRFAVPILSKHYAQKSWPKYELRAAGDEARKRDYEFLLIIQLDDIPLDTEGFPNIPQDTAYLDLRREGLRGVVRVLLGKLGATQRGPSPKVWAATFGLLMEDLVSDDELPPEAPRSYPLLCDWLEEDLLQHLRRSHLRDVAFLEDERTGESLSVRVSFTWDPDRQGLDLRNPDWWEVLEVQPLESIYPTL